MSQNKTQPTTEKTPTQVTQAFLQHWPLPRLDEQGDKDSRGSVLIIGGSVEMPGGVILAATAALRSGVGRLALATCHSVAVAVGVAVPEARVLGLPETPAGGIDPTGADRLVARATQAQAVLIGPGMIDEGAIGELLRRLLPQIDQSTMLILDAGALTAGALEPQLLKARDGRVIFTPHAGEMAYVLGMDKAAVIADPQAISLRCARDFGAVSVLKGPTTWIASAAAELYAYHEGTVGLATSGSGDTLAGVIAGLAPRAASPSQAAAWGVYLHGEAGNHLSHRLGSLGFLPRELPHEIPRILAAVEHGTIDRGDDRHLNLQEVH
jgi:ADP-dependent NAD(P)H-hydrate dehydratase